jgi:cell division transport system permease protein
MFSLFGLVIYIGSNLTSYLKENLIMEVYLKNDASTIDIKELELTALSGEAIKSKKYIDKNEAAVLETKELDQDFVKELGYNPLPSSYELNLKREFATPEQVTLLKKKILESRAVESVLFQEGNLTKLQNNINTAIPILFILCLIFVLIAVLLINNTVRLNLFSQRFLIKSMQYVGATKGFITKPFIVRSILNGLWAGVIASLLIFNTGYMLLYFLPDMDVVLPDFDRSINLFLLVILSLCLSLAGIIISVICTWFAARKYLKMKIEDLY